MTYYEGSSGARVFSAGAMNFGGQIALWPETIRLLENVWALSSEALRPRRRARNLFESCRGQELGL